MRPTHVSNQQNSVSQTGSRHVHSALVRITHWLLVLSFLCLLVSGVAILIVHPRFYWGETGTFGMPSLFDLPLTSIRGHSGWGRYLHFLSAWICVLSGLTYFVAGCITQHFRRKLLPAKTELLWHQILRVISDHLRWKRPSEHESWNYNVVQQLTYLVVIFLLFPSIIWTGLAMSPAITSVFPFMATVLGGHQSARTIHFIVVNLLLVFLIIHVAMLFLVGFKSHVRAMITGYSSSNTESS
jgi:thiosulfate reductase cytochrome b subunit